MRKVRVHYNDVEYTGLFHGYSSGYAIVERPDGTVDTPNLQRIRFIEPPHREIQSRIDRLVIKVEQLHEHGNIGSMAHCELMNMLDEMKGGIDGGRDIV